MAVSGSVALGLDLTETATPDMAGATAVAKLGPTWVKTLTSGTGLDQCNKIFVDTATLAGSGSQAYDLDSGTLVGQMGQVLAAFSRIVAIFIRRTDTPAASTQDENLTIGGDWILTKYLLPGGDTLSGVTIPLHPGGIFMFVAPNSTGVAVTATTGDGLTITNASSADSCSYELVVLGS